VALKTTCIKNVKFKIIKIRTGCQYGEHLNWAAQNLRLGRGLDIAALSLSPEFLNWGRKRFARRDATYYWKVLNALFYHT